MLLVFLLEKVADDIKKFKIKGMAIGDSVLDYFAGRDVVNNIISSNDNRSDEFHISSFYQHENFKKFDDSFIFRY